MGIDGIRVWKMKNDLIRGFGKDLFTELNIFNSVKILIINLHLLVMQGVTK